MKKEEILEIAITELKNIYFGLEKEYRELKNKFVLFSSGQLAFLGFIYGSASQDKENNLKALFFPSELSSQIFYVIGVILSISSLFFLFQGFFPRGWEYPPQSNDFKKIKFKTKLEILNYIKEEYYKAIEFNKSVYTSRKSTYKRGLVCLLIGNVILFIVRFFGNIYL